MEDEKHLEARLYLLASKLPTPRGPKMAAGILATKRSWGWGTQGGKEVERTPRATAFCVLRFFFSWGRHIQFKDTQSAQGMGRGGRQSSGNSSGE